MLDNPKPENPTFGMVTNGSNFRFIKFIKQGTPQYALSDEFIIDRQDDFYHFLKQIGQLITSK